jgi:hypothetical protein
MDPIGITGYNFLRTIAAVVSNLPIRSLRGLLSGDRALSSAYA